MPSVQGLMEFVPCRLPTQGRPGRWWPTSGTVAELLDMTPRAARRVLLTLIDQGLAWQLPPVRWTGPGRPRQTYRLLVEQLHA